MVCLVLGEVVGFVVEGGFVGFVLNVCEIVLDNGCNYIVEKLLI